MLIKNYIEPLPNHFITFEKNVTKANFKIKKKIPYATQVAKNKINSTDFFKFDSVVSNKIKSSTFLQSIPVYTVLNDKNELITTNSFIKKKALATVTENNEKYFLPDDPIISFQKIESTQVSKNNIKEFGNSKIFGLFFFSQSDAEIYRKNILAQNFASQPNVGLSINCLSLDSALKIKKEAANDVKFHFIPDFEEALPVLKKLNNIKKKDTTFSSLKNIPIYYLIKKGSVENPNGSIYTFLKKEQAIDFYEKNKKVLKNSSTNSFEKYASFNKKIGLTTLDNLCELAPEKNDMFFIAKPPEGEIIYPNVISSIKKQFTLKLFSLKVFFNGLYSLRA